MTPTEDLQTDASDHAGAIARWDDEGGACKSSRSKTSAELPNKYLSPSPRIGNKQ